MCVCKVMRGSQSFKIEKVYHDEGGRCILSFHAVPVPTGEPVHVCTQGSYGNRWQGYHNLSLHHDYPDLEHALHAQGFVMYRGE